MSGQGGIDLNSLNERDRRIRAWAFLPSNLADITAQAQQEQGKDGLLWNMPFGVKDIIDVAGMPTLYGVPMEPAYRKSYDAATVSLLRKAGAIPIGKTVTSEYAFRRPGPTRNPRNLNYSPGGSSSGSAAAVAAGMVPFALSTQTGGSIIRPAAYCGVFGFKPTFGYVSRDGMKITCESLDVIGWHANSIGTTKKIAHILLPFSPEKQKRKKLNDSIIAVVTYSAESPLKRKGQAAIDCVVKAMALLGMPCHGVRLAEEFELLSSAHLTIMKYEFARNLSPVIDTAKEFLSPILLDNVSEGFSISDNKYLEARRYQIEKRHSWTKLFGDSDFIVTPSAPGAAPYGTKYSGSAAFNRVWSLLGWPCLHIPICNDERGLPIGIQIVGKMDGDIDLLEFAEMFIEKLKLKSRRCNH